MTFFWVVLYFITYLVVSRQLGFLLFYLIHGEVYPPYGYKNGEPANEHTIEPSPYRCFFWIPVIGDIVAGGYFLIIGIFLLIEFLDYFLILDHKLDQFLKWNKERIKKKAEAKKISEENIFDFAKKDPKAFARAVKEVERLSKSNS